jgi:hypothetical protein
MLQKPLSQPHVLILGHSHVSALSKGYRFFLRRGEDAAPLKGRFAPLERPKSRKNVPGVSLEEALSGPASDFVVSCVGGNSHNVMGLVNHSQRFDFVLPEAPNLPLDNTAEILPSGAVRAALLKRTERNLNVLEELRARTDNAIIHLESPPPVPSEKHIREYPGPFRTKMEERGVAPAMLRYKLWRLHSSLFRERCKKLNILFLPTPPVAQDANGMMVERAWNADATHGNRWYGIQVLRHLTAFIEQVESGRFQS